MSAQKKSIVFLGVDMHLFKACFFRGEEEQWDSYELIIIDYTSATASADLTKYLQESRVRSVVIEDVDMDALLLSTLKKFYDSGGWVVFFGIYGENVYKLSRKFDLPEPWHFSAYTKHEYEITNSAIDCLGYDKMEQQYTKCNLLQVPIQDRWMVPKAQPLHQYIDDHAGCLDGEEPDEEWKDEAEKAKGGYIKYCESLYNQCPLAVHKDKNGGRLAYLGFVNGDENDTLTKAGMEILPALNYYPAPWFGTRKSRDNLLLIERTIPLKEIYHSLHQHSTYSNIIQTNTNVINNGK